MKRQKANWLAWSVCAVLIATVSSVAAARPRRVAPPRSVVDYYLLLPNEPFPGGTREDRLDQLDPKRGGLVDVRNGYLETPGSDSGSPLSVCLFKRPDKSYLFAVSSNLAPDNGSWEPSLQFYIYRNGQLVDVTRSTLPRRFSRSLGYKLPRYGRTIKVITKSSRTVYELLWVNGRFRTRRR